MSTLDLVVVGAGPAGLATAIFARQAGLSVCVLDGGPADGDKACGEGLMPGVAPLLAELGIDPPGEELVGVAYQQGSTRVEHRFPGAPGRGVRRTVLSDALREQALTRGATIWQEKYVSLRQDGESVTVTTDAHRDIDSRYVIACDGLHSRVASDLGVVVAPRKRAKRYGLRQHFQVAPWSSTIEVFYVSDAELYITPVSRDTVGVAVLGRKGVNLDDTLAMVPSLAARLANAPRASPLRGAGPFPHRARTQLRGRVLLVGDAGGYVDAITGEGLRVGFAQAKVAVSAVVANQPQRYPAQWKRVTREFRLLTRGLVALAQSPLRRSIVPLAKSMPGLFGIIVNRLAR